VKQAEHIQTGTNVSLLQPAKINLLRIGSNNSLAFTADRADRTICSEGVKKDRTGGVGQKELVSCSRSVEERFQVGCHSHEARGTVFSEFDFHAMKAVPR
jgi:hypothetical protein